MADGVNGTVKGMEPAGSDPSVDLVARISARHQLPVRDDPVLSIRQRGDRQITWTVLIRYMRLEIVQVRHGTSVNEKA